VVSKKALFIPELEKSVTVNSISHTIVKCYHLSNAKFQIKYLIPKISPSVVPDSTVVDPDQNL
jgi:hypothetical protein